MGAAAWRLRGLAAAIRTRLAAWAEAERGRFGPWLAVAGVAGSAGYFNLVAEPPAWPALTAIAAAAVLLAATLLDTPWRAAVPRSAAALLLAGALGFASAQWAASRAPPMPPLPPRAVVLTASVHGVDVLPDGRRLVLDDVRLAPDQPPLARMVRVRMKRNDPADPAAGDRVQLRTVLRPPAPPAYPGGWDLQRDAWFAGLGGGGVALNNLVILERDPAPRWAARLQGLRDAVARRAFQALPGTTGTIAATMVMGDTRAIPHIDRDAFRDSGLAHLLSVSGLHIATIMGLFMFTTRLGLAAWPYAALRWNTRAIAAATALLAGAAYLLLTGASVPMIRSFATACLVTLGILVGRRALSFRGLALGAGALVLIAPNQVVGASFQMSFAAVLALIAGYEVLRPALAALHGPGWRRLGGHAAALVLTSLLAGTASAPYGAYHFGHAQLYFIAANLIAVPITSLWALPWGVAALFLMPLGLERLAFIPMGVGLDAIIWIARTVAAWPAATLPTPPMPPWGLAVLSLGLAWLCLWRSRPRLAGIPLIAAGLLSPLAFPRPDLLVSPDARLIALRTPAGYALQSRSGASRFVRDAWDDHLASGPFRPLDDDTAGCDATSCRAGNVLLLRGASYQADCAGAALLISAEPARGICPGVRLLDRFSVWRDGAFAVWLQPGPPLVLSDRAVRGDRPWVPPPPTPRRHVPDLPMAPTETMPAESE